MNEEEVKNIEALEHLLAEEKKALEEIRTEIVRVRNASHEIGVHIVALLDVAQAADNLHRANQLEMGAVEMNKRWEVLLNALNVWRAIPTEPPPCPPN